MKFRRGELSDGIESNLDENHKKVYCNGNLDMHDMSQLASHQSVDGLHATHLKCASGQWMYAQHFDGTPS